MSSTSFQFHQLSNTQLRNLINERARFKKRSHDTHTETHRPQLESSSSINSSSTTTVCELPSQIDIVLLGDSMLERFQTTGKHTQIGQLQYPQIFNAGVGGDKVENVLYRINLGLLTMLKAKNPKLVVIQIGTNNLQPKRSLHGLHLDDYHLLLQALLRLLPAQTQILVTGLFKRRDVDEQCVLQSNMDTKQIVDTINTQETERRTEETNRVHWIESPKEIQLEHLADNVHLNLHGYQIWDEKLYSKIEQLLSTS
jgi:lysophospholipase L1-like esterase